MLKNLLNRNSVVNNYKNLVNQINAVESRIKTLTDSELRSQTIHLQKRYQNEYSQSSFIAESFALTRRLTIFILISFL